MSTDSRDGYTPSMPARAWRTALWAAAMFTAVWAVNDAAAQGGIPGLPGNGCGVTISCAPPAPAPSPGPGSTCGPAPGGPTGPQQCLAAGPASQSSGAGPNVGAGNPINVISGNKYQQETDLAALPGVLGLELVRHYNSAYSSPTAGNGSLGRGWKLSYETQLFATGSTVQIVQADGARLVFNRDPRNPGLCSSAEPSRGQVLIGRDAQGEQYIWVWNDGRRLGFNAQGRLTQILAPTGEFVTLQHDPAGHLLKVTDPQGRSLRLNYLDARAAKGDRFAGVQSIDTPVGRYVYEYGSELPKGSAHEPKAVLANLVKVKLPTHHEPDTKAHDWTERGISSSSISRVYHYEDPRHPTLLTGVSVVGSGSDGKLMNQRLVTWAYDGNGKAILSAKGDAQSSIAKVTLNYKAPPSLSGRPGQTVLTNSLGATTTYTHQVIAGQYRLIEVRGAGCATCGEPNWRHEYDKQGRLTRSVKLDERGKPAYASVSETDAYGRITRSGRINYQDGKAQVTRWLARYEYAAPVRAADGDMRVPEQPTLIARPSVVPGKEHTVRVAYNEAGQPLTVTESGFSPLDEQGKPSTQGTPISRTTIYSYTRINNRSLLVQVDGPLPNGPAGTPTDSDITQLRYDERGDRVVAVTFPLNLQARFQHDAAGRLVAHTPVDGVPVQQSLSTFGQPVKWQRGGVAVTIAWDAAGRPSVIQRNDGSSVSAVYDAAGRLVAVVDAQGSRREVELDSDGRILKTLWRDAAGDVPYESLAYQYDDMGRPVADSRGLRIGYDPLGRLGSVSDVLGRQSRYTYDAQGRLVGGEQRVPQAQGASLLRTALGASESATTVFTQLLYRGSESQASGVVAGNGARTVSDHDDFGRTVRQSSPDTGITIFRHDAADRIVEKIDAAGNRTEFTYEALGRLLRRVTRNAGGDTDVATWRYDGTRLVQADNAHQSDRYRWDAQGRLVEQATLITGAGGATSHPFVTGYRYDGLDRLSEKRLPDGLTLVQTYDPRGQAEQLMLRYPNGKQQPIFQALQGSAAHGLQEVAFGNGTRTAYARDKQRRVAAIATVAQLPGAQPTPLYAQHLRYDEAGRIVGIERDGRPERYAYDGFDRLVEVHTAHEHRRYAYDAVGNRTALWEPPSQQLGTSRTGLGEQRPQQSWTYQPESNRLLDILREGAGTAAQAGTAWRYDGNGSPTAIAERSYRYGVNGRLQEVAQSHKTLARYRYNAAGERVSKTSAAGTTHYLYAQNKIVVEADDQGRITAHYVYFGHAPIAKIETLQGQASRASGWSDVRPSAWQRWVRWVQTLTGNAEDALPAAVQAVRVLYLHADHLGTPRVATDGMQRIVWRASYDAFGAATVHEDPDRDEQATQLNLRLPGQYLDAETATHYNYFRDYDPALGRYLQSDPIGLKGGLNTYAYVRGSPLEFIDPLGLRSFVRDGIIYIRPEDFTVPFVEIPNTVGAAGVSPSDLHFHDYNVVTPTRLTSCQAGRGFRNNPTPGNDVPASSTGSRNDVGDIPTTDGTNFVRSFFIPSPNPSRWTDITVNYTITGEHGLDEGFVIRFGEIRMDGSVILRSYGEGNDIRQTPTLRFIWGSQVEEVWQQNHREIINNNPSCECQ